MSNDNDLRILHGTVQADGTMEYRSNLTPKSLTGPVILLYDPRPVIPIIFIPGIMATRLWSTKLKQPVWDPPNTVGDMIKVFFNYIFKSSAERVEELDPKNVEVLTELPANVDLRKEHPESAWHREEKGWGALYATPYHAFMAYLEQTLNPLVCEREEVPDNITGEKCTLPKLPEKFKTDPQEYGALDWTAEPLTQEEFGKAIGTYRYDVWGMGYNWLQSNGQSAADVWERIGKILKSYPENAINKQKRVILITHSMGGLVARSLYKEFEAKCGEQDKRILGVIHIAQPAAGAPAVYRRMRAGDTGLAQVVTGRNAADITGVLARAQGGLELLPFACYSQGRNWLACPWEADRPGNDQSLPFGDPYNNIYKTNRWYGLLPDQNLKLALEGMEATEANLKKVRKDFEDMIDDVQTFHNSITGTYHPQTYAIWGNSKEQMAFGGFSWEQRERVYSPETIESTFDFPDGIQDDGEGRVSAGKYDNILREMKVPGDVTVPDISARDQQLKAKVCFIQGDGHGKHNDEHGWEHMEPCNKDQVRWAAVYSIVKLVSEKCP